MTESSTIRRTSPWALWSALAAYAALASSGCAGPTMAVMRDTVPPSVTEKIEGAAGTLTVRRVVHASVLLEAGDVKLLTDPWFSETSAYTHGEPIALTVDKLPQLTAIVASHGHYDHYDIAAMATYRDKSVPVIVRPEMVQAAKDAGFTDVRALDHWQSTEVNGAKITATPAAHGVPESTYVIEMAGFTVYFGGDTRLIPELRAIPEKFPSIDLALLAVNGLSVTMAGQMVMNAEEAADVVKLLNAKVAVPMHYTFHGNWFTDTFVLSYNGTPQRFVEATKARAPTAKVHVLETGAPLVLEKAPAASSEREAVPESSGGAEKAKASALPPLPSGNAEPVVVMTTLAEASAMWLDVDHARVAPLVGDPRVGAFTMFIELPAKSTSPKHTHTFDKQGLVVKGTVVHVVDGDAASGPEKLLGTNAFFFIPANVAHLTKCVSAEPCVMLYSQPGALDMKPAK